MIIPNNFYLRTMMLNNRRNIPVYAQMSDFDVTHLFNVLPSIGVKTPWLRRKKMSRCPTLYKHFRKADFPRLLDLFGPEIGKALQLKDEYRADDVDAHLFTTKRIKWIQKYSGMDGWIHFREKLADTRWVFSQFNDTCRFETWDRSVDRLVSRKDQNNYSFTVSTLYDDVLAFVKQHRLPYYIKTEVHDLLYVNWSKISEAAEFEFKFFFDPQNEF